MVTVPAGDSRSPVLLTVRVVASFHTYNLWQFLAIEKDAEVPELILRMVDPSRILFLLKAYPSISKSSGYFLRPLPQLYT